VPAGPGCQGCDVGAWEVLRVEEIPPTMGQSEERPMRGLGLWAGGLAVYVASSQSQGHW